jgi:hypothetical protein
MQTSSHPLPRARTSRRAARRSSSRFRSATGIEKGLFTSTKSDIESMLMGLSHPAEGRLLGFDRDEAPKGRPRLAPGDRVYPDDVAWDHRTTYCPSCLETIQDMVLHTQSRASTAARTHRARTLTNRPCPVSD